MFKLSASTYTYNLLLGVAVTLAISLSVIVTEYYCTDFSQKAAAASGKGKMFRKLDAMRRPIGQGSERER